MTCAIALTPTAVRLTHHVQNQSFKPEAAELSLMTQRVHLLELLDGWPRATEREFLQCDAHFALSFPRQLLAHPPVPVKFAPSLNSCPVYHGRLLPREQYRACLSRRGPVA